MMIYLLCAAIILLKLADLLYKYNYYMQIDINDVVVVVCAVMILCLI
jgi:hypothetical protein